MNKDRLDPQLASQVGLDHFDDREEELFVGLLLVTGRFIQRLDEICKKWGITDDQYNVLRILRGARPAGQPRFAIAEKLLNRAPDVTRLLDRLQSKGLVVRSRSGPDRRRSISSITPQGLALLSKMSDDIKAANMEITQGLSPEEKRRLAALLHRMIPEEEKEEEEKGR
jgi:DNA-binding MarR family transcriptional regulator